MKPARDARRKRGDDDLVERTAFDLLLHRGARIALTDGSLDVGTGGLVEQRQRELERGRGLLSIRVPIRTRHQQDEAAAGAPGTRTNLLQQPWRRRGSVSHHQDAGGYRRGHPAMIAQHSPLELSSRNGPQTNAVGAGSVILRRDAPRRRGVRSAQCAGRSSPLDYPPGPWCCGVEVQPTTSA